jgi:hypothetical protein
LEAGDPEGEPEPVDVNITSGWYDNDFLVFTDTWRGGVA